MNSEPTREPPADEAARDSLFWTAFQYAVDELSEAEATSFEVRLAEEQPAREALAKATAMIDASSAVEAGRCVETSPLRPTIMPASVERSLWQTPAVWFACGAAACLALMFATSRPEAPKEVAQVSNVLPNDVQHELAMVWAEGRTDDENGGGSSSDMPADAFVEHALSESAEIELLLPVEEPSAPDWLITALAESAPAASPEN
jgi:hypothetical protein